MILNKNDDNGNKMVLSLAADTPFVCLRGSGRKRDFLFPIVVFSCKIVSCRFGKGEKQVPNFYGRVDPSIGNFEMNSSSEKDGGWTL